MQNFAVHSIESECRKSECLGMDQVNNNRDRILVTDNTVHMITSKQQKIDLKTPNLWCTHLHQFL